jgi:hypothetical protein
MVLRRTELRFRIDSLEIEIESEQHMNSQILTSTVDPKQNWKTRRFVRHLGSENVQRQAIFFANDFPFVVVIRLWTWWSIPQSGDVA